MDVMGDNRAYGAGSAGAPSNPFNLLVASSADVAGEISGRLLSSRMLAFSNGGDELVMASPGAAYDPVHAYSMSVAAVITNGSIVFDGSDAGVGTGSGVGGPRSLGAARGGPPFTLVSLDAEDLTDTTVFVGSCEPGVSFVTNASNVNVSPYVPTFACISYADNALCVLFGDTNVMVGSTQSGTFQTSSLLPTNSNFSTPFTLPGGYQGMAATFTPDTSQLFVSAFDGSDTRLVVFTVDDITLLAPTWTVQSDDLVLAGTGTSPQDMQITSDGLFAVVGCPDFAASGPYGLGAVSVMTRANTGAAFTNVALIRPLAAISGATGGFGCSIGMNDIGSLAAIGEMGADSGAGKAWGVPGVTALGSGTHAVTAVGYEFTHSHGAGAAYGISVAVNESATAVAIHTSDIVNKVDCWT